VLLQPTYWILITRDQQRDPSDLISFVPAQHGGAPHGWFGCSSS
jgi:hypothetical protein